MKRAYIYKQGTSHKAPLPTECWMNVHLKLYKSTRNLPEHSPHLGLVFRVLAFFTQPETCHGEEHNAFINKICSSHSKDISREWLVTQSILHQENTWQLLSSEKSKHLGGEGQKYSLLLIPPMHAICSHRANIFDYLSFLKKKKGKISLFFSSSCSLPLSTSLLLSVHINITSHLLTKVQSITWIQADRP